MAKGLQKSLQFCISKLKRSSSRLQHPLKLPLPSTNWLLSACKYPKTPSFAVDRHNPIGLNAAATLADVDRFLVENFSSLYSSGDDGGGDENKDHDPNVFISDLPQKFLRSSRRLNVNLFSSNPLVKEAQSSDYAVEEGLAVNGVAMLTETRDPHNEFRRSMQEMVEEHEMGQCKPLDWEFLEDLLLCYLNLNEKRSHKYILGAFVDMMVSSYHEENGKTDQVKKEK